MTKSRTPLFALVPFAAAWPGTAMAEQDRPVTAEEVLAASYARIHEAMGVACPRGEAGADAIVVCGRDRDSSMRLPLGSQPEQGTRQHLVAGEAPSARAAMDAGDVCLRLCYRPVTIPIIPMIHALGSGLDRILHPD